MIKSLKDIISKNPHTDSPIEELLYVELKRYDLHPVAGYDIFPFFIDLAFPQIKLAIEADGRQWHSSRRQIEKDNYRQKKLENIGWKFERFPGSFIFKEKEVIAAKIALKYFKGKLTVDQEMLATGYLVKFFTKKDIRFAERLATDTLERLVVTGSEKLSPDLSTSRIEGRK
jgi:very-short-patch-repair endonuclease